MNREQMRDAGEAARGQRGQRAAGARLRRRRHAPGTSLF